MSSSNKLTVNWCHAITIPQNIIPSQLRDFLLDPGSTTKRMQREYAAQTKVEILNQDWRFPPHSETQQLNIPLGQKALIREVHLSCQDKVWMYARTVFPESFFTGKNHQLLSELDNRPLGELLFSDPTMQRSEFELAILQPEHLEYEWATQQLTALTSFTTSKTSIPAKKSLLQNKFWARRSIIKLQTQPLLLTEIFFPGFFQLVKITD